MNDLQVWAEGMRQAYLMWLEGFLPQALVSGIDRFASVISAVMTIGIVCWMVRRMLRGSILATGLQHYRYRFSQSCEKELGSEKEMHASLKTSVGRKEVCTNQK